LWAFADAEEAARRPPRELVRRAVEDALGRGVEVTDPQLRIQQDDPLAQDGRDGAEPGEVEVHEEAGVAG